MSVIRELDLKDLPKVKDYLHRFPPQVSEITFTNLFVWSSARPILIAEFEDTIFFLTENRWVFGHPLGKASPLSAAKSLDVDVKGFIRIPEETARELKEEGLSITSDRDNADYVYKVSDLAGLEGRRYHKKRNLVKQCLEHYTCGYEEITSHNIIECMQMQDRWCEARDCGLNPGLCSEYNAIREAFTSYNPFGLIGGAVRVDGIIQAYALGEELAPKTAVCHFEKAMPDIQGLSQLITQRFALNSLQHFEFVNREQDLGIPGLRQAKESYFPHHMVQKFTARFAADGRENSVPLEPKECYRHNVPVEI